MRITGFIVFTLTGLLVFMNAFSQQDLQSLRGIKTIDDVSLEADVKPWQRDQDPIARDYVSQPPLIPHKIEGYQVTRNFNKCLSCHSWANYKKSGATKVSQTHFEDRERSIRANIAGTRYFCTQCHVPQADAQPLVENTFEPVEVLQQQ